MFKFITTFVVFVLVPTNISAVTDEQTTKIAAHILEHGLKCIKEHPITNEDIVSFRSKQVPTGENAACFAACMFKAAGMMDNDGNISSQGFEEKAKTIFDDEKDLKNLEEYINTCISVNDEKVNDGAEGCERAILAFKCLAENSSKFGFDFNF